MIYIVCLFYSSVTTQLRGGCDNPVINVHNKDYMQSSAIYKY
jgi:hypothetical protein